ALDGHLTMSIDIVNKVKVKVGKVVPVEEAFVVVPKKVKELTGSSLEGYFDGPKISETEAVVFREGKVISVSGIWDLPFLGGEFLDLEACYYQHSGVNYDLHTLD